MHAVPPFAARYARQLPQVVSDLLTTTALPASLTLSRAGNAMLYDSTGKLTYAPANMLLNSATLSTQTVTVAVGVSYIVSFQGTGSIALSGAASATISGTGASDRVYQKVTATTTSLVCTVSGSVTSAQVEPVTYQTTPAPYVATTSAAYYGPRLDYDPSTLAARGLLVEATATNLAVYSNNLSSSGWNIFNVTRSATATGPDGVSGSAQTFTASAGNTYHYAQNATQVTITANANYAYSIYAKAGTSNYAFLTAYGAAGARYAGAVFDLSNSANTSATQTFVGGTTGTVVSTKQEAVGGGWYRLTLVAAMNVTAGYIFAGIAGSATGNTVSGFGEITFNAAGTETVTLYGTQEETGTVATSYIPTTSASVARAAESLTAASYSTQPTILQYRPTPDGTRARKIISPYSGISSETGEWLEKIAIYAPSTPTALLNQVLNVDGQL